VGPQWRKRKTIRQLSYWVVHTVICTFRLFVSFVRKCRLVVYTQGLTDMKSISEEFSKQLYWWVTSATCFSRYSMNCCLSNFCFCRLSSCFSVNGASAAAAAGGASIFWKLTSCAPLTSCTGDSLNVIEIILSGFIIRHRRLRFAVLCTLIDSL